jgi:hypothetical protein
MTYRTCAISDQAPKDDADSADANPIGNISVGFGDRKGIGSISDSLLVLGDEGIEQRIRSARSDCRRQLGSDATDSVCVEHRSMSAMPPKADQSQSTGICRDGPIAQNAWVGHCQRKAKHASRSRAEMVNPSSGDGTTDRR